MAASGSCVSSGRGKYDVFLSFRGSDTRKFFTGHLYRALEQKGINTFMGSEEQQKDNQVSDLLLKAIEDSRLSVVVFSKNYASSKWCLGELVKIMDCVDRKKQAFVPIFYQVDPSDSRTLKTTLADAFAAHEHKPNADLEELQSWSSALSRATNLWAWDSEDYEDDAKLIDDIVEDILNKLMHGSSTEARGLVGIDSHIQKISLLLSTGVDDVRVVGIYGIAGIGKTTLAKAVYDQVAHQFDQAYFFDNIKEGFMKNGPLLLQHTLLSTISKESVRSLASFNMMMETLRLMLGRKKVLLVLDDVDDIAPLETLLGEQHPFGKGSRIIITTRDSQLLSGVGNTYGLTSLPDDEALELFKQYAFRTNHPLEEYNLLSRRAIEYAQGLPLALRVLGAFLNNKSSMSEWESAFENLKNIPLMEIHDVLRMSFDGLDDSEKNIFLDIACFFRGMDKDNALDILDSCGFFPHSRLRVLVNRALISISGHNTLEMHDLLQDMGREIVRQGSPEKPGKCSRLWSYEDINHVLTQNTATEAVESINLDLSKSKLFSLNAEAFVSMNGLRLMKINFCIKPIDYDGTEYLPCNSWDQRDDCKQHLIGDFNYLSHELRCLIWDGFPLKSLPSNFCPNNLVYLSMRYSHLEKLWGGTKPPEKLKRINLGHSEYLTATPDFTEVVNLEKLNLEFCSRLSDVHPSISALLNLVSLSFKGCKELQILPSSIHLKSLKTLDLSGCSNLEKFPEISGIMKELSEIYLDETAIKELPSSIERLQGIRILSLRDCRSLVRLPENISNLGCLTELTLSGCSKLNHLPENLGNLASLRKLEVGRSGIKDFTFSTFCLNKLITLSRDGCQEMNSPFSSRLSSVDENCSYSSLLYLDLSDCNFLKLPDSIGCLSSLKTLDLHRNNLEVLPATMSRLHHLTHLDLSDCNLLKLSDSIGCLSSLKTLDLRRNNLEVLPATMSRLCHLTHLELESCTRLKSIPELPSSISFIDAHDCKALETVSAPKPQYSGNLFFTFSNCLKLVKTNLFRDVVESHSNYQGNHLRALSFNMSLPGSEIPEWFCHQCTGSSVIVHLPLNWLDSNFLGFAICAVCNFKGAHDNASNISARCFCTFKGNHREYSFSFNLLDWSFKSERYLESDHMFLGYVPWSEYCWIEKGEQIDERYYTEATFRIVVENGVHSPDFGAPAQYHSIRCCGIRLFNANNERQNLSITKTKYHFDNYGVAHEDFGKAMVEE